MHRLPYIFFLCILLTACGPAPAATSAPATETVQPTRQVTLSPTNTRVTTFTPTLTPYSKVIDKTNLERLALLNQWDVDSGLFYRSGNFWFSDSRQFIVPWLGDYPMDGLQSFTVGEQTPPWSFQVKQLDFTINDHDQVIINQEGMIILDKQGNEIQTIRTNKKCDVYSKPSDYILAIAGTDLVITGVQDSYSEGGLYGNDTDKARLLIWDLNKHTCSELIEQFDGYLSSLSASDDGQYISYSVIDIWAEPPKSTIQIYDLNLRKEKCELNGGEAHFTSLGELIVQDYDSKEGSFSIISMVDCAMKRKFDAGAEMVNSFTLSPNGELLAGITDQSVYFWDLKTGKKLYEIKSDGRFLDILGFSPDGHYLVVVNDSGKDQVMLYGISGK